MTGFSKLALIAAGAMVLIGTEAQASPMTEGTFVSYMGGGRWNHGAAFMMHFVNWRDSNPEWSVRNIGWVERYSGEGGGISNPILVFDPEANNGHGAMVDDRIPTWKRTNIPEPTTALIFGGMMGLMAMRRRTI